MSNGDFKYAGCLMKHHIRREGWLKFARERYRKLRSGRKSKHQRPLRYFTFCAENAVDVLLFDLEDIIPYDAERGFDSVFFFHRTPENVIETRKRIPRANGFPGDFVRTVLINDPEANDLPEAPVPPEERENTAETRELENRLMTHRQFVNSFPFDIINLDLEEFLFKPRDPIPGHVINAFRRVFSWQQRPLLLGTREELLTGFTLMLTTQVGPPNMSDVYREMLADNLQENLRLYDTLQPLLVERTGCESVAVLLGENFDAFFKLAMPKLLLSSLMENDWYVDPEPGIVIYEFEREHPTGDYKLLHLVMDVVRQDPPVHRRPPRRDAEGAVAAYSEVVHRLFREPEIVVSLENINQATLEADLARITARGREFYPDE